MQGIQTKYIDSPVGKLAISANREGLRAVLFVDSNNSKHLIPQETDTTNDIIEATIVQLIEYFDKKRTQFNIPLNLEGTDFQKRVWQSLLAIPFGSICSYKSLSIALGDVKAIRAVGTANGKNPISIIVPCHRVIGSDNTLVGYGGELWRKEKLLILEGAYKPSFESQLSIFG